MEYEYKTIQFEAKLEHGIISTAKGSPVEDQFSAFIKKHAIDGWEYYRLENVHAYVKAGCLPSLFGKKDEVWFYDVAVFRRPK